MLNSYKVSTDLTLKGFEKISKAGKKSRKLKGTRLLNRLFPFTQGTDFGSITPARNGDGGGAPVA